MRRLIAATIFSAMVGVSQAATMPTYGDFPVAAIYSGYPTPADLRDPAARQYRSRLFAASRLEPNFAGHYHLVVWGCGTSCSMGAIVEAATGRVTMLPSVANYGGTMGENFEAIEGTPHSRLLIFHGHIDDDGPDGDHYYLIQDGQLRHLASKIIKAADGDEAKGATAAQLADCAKIAKADERLTCFDVLSGR